MGEFIENGLAITEHQGARSFWLKTERAEVYVSETGGHMAPVAFKLKHRWVAPFYSPPWSPEACDAGVPAVYRFFRGSFLGFPFSRQPKEGAPFGSTANERWKVVRNSVRSLEMSQKPDPKGGLVEKRIFLENDQRAIYQEHRLSGFGGRCSAGLLSLVQLPENSVSSLGVSAFRVGRASSTLSAPAEGTYSFLDGGAAFSSLETVPLVDDSTADFTRLPLMPGYDAQLLMADVADALPWVAVTMPGYVWFSLRRPDTLPGLLLWYANGGMHGEPWRGRLRNVLGIGEVCSWFDDTVQASRQQPLESEGVATALRLSRRKPTVLRTVQGVHPVDRDFGRVRSIAPLDDGSGVEILSFSGESCKVPLNWRFLIEEG